MRHHRARSRVVIAATLSFLAVAAVLPAVASAYDPEDTFRKNTFVLSFEGGGGHQTSGPNVSPDGTVFDTGLTLWYFGARASLLPFEPLGRNTFLYGALEAGLEPIFQRYESPVQAYYAGLGAVLRYHFLSLGRFVPFVDLGAAAGGTDLKVREIRSDFAFLLFGSVGAEVFVTDSTALYVGYRLVHISNGNTSKPNRGFEAHTGVAGVSFYIK